MPQWLVIDDEQSIGWGLTELGRRTGHEVRVASSAEQAFDEVREAQPDVIILDVRLPGMDGLTAIDRLRQLYGPVPIIVITAYGDLETAVKAVRQGAVEYVLKPFDAEEIKRCVLRVLAGRTTVANDSPQGVPAEFVGRSPAMQQVFKQIALAAASDSPVLLRGESGTGKEIAARAIHRYSARAGAPFVAVNAAALSPTLAEAELFGHTRGAFTGADSNRNGLLVRANRGTLFLDEVADIPLEMQVKLLRVLEQREVLPVGSDTPVDTHFRLISATHRDLAAQARRGAFRHDLFFRISAFQIEIPPLRERTEDIVPLAQHFLEWSARRGGLATPALADDTQDELQRRPWYGNARELRNTMEYASIVARGGLILPDHLPPCSMPAAGRAEGDAAEELEALVRAWAADRLGDEGATGLYEALLERIEPPLFQACLEAHQGHCAAAARRLGLHRATLRKKLDRHAIKYPSR